MSLFIASLNSGSNGNCYYIGNEKEAVLIDGGISCRETENRMKRLGLSMSAVKAIFVSHEHTDHITGVPGISKKYELPVYITKDTYKNSRMPVNKKLVFSFQADQPVKFNELSVIAFTKSHDACDPHSFMVTDTRVNIGIFTDIGYPCKQVIRYFKKCHAAFLEANYCEDMLESGSYPRYLKNRISGRKGHLSNVQALKLFVSHRSSQLSHLILSHLSENNNSPELVDKLFRKESGATKIIVASRFGETALYQVEATSGRRSISMRKPGVEKHKDQLSLF